MPLFRKHSVPVALHPYSVQDVTLPKRFKIFQFIASGTGGRSESACLFSETPPVTGEWVVLGYGSWVSAGKSNARMFGTTSGQLRERKLSWRSV